MPQAGEKVEAREVPGRDGDWIADPIPVPNPVPKDKEPDAIDPEPANEPVYPPERYELK